MVKTIIKWLVLTILLAYVAAAAVWARQEAASMRCKGVDINIINGRSLDEATSKGVREEAAVICNGSAGKLLRDIDSRAMENKLALLPAFESVECAFTAEGKLKVDITPMVPEMRVFDGWESYYINKDGKRMKSKASVFADVPVVSGRFSDGVSPQMLLGLSRYIQRHAELREIVSMIQMNDSDNILLIPRIHGHVVNFGDTSRKEEKTRALLAFYRKVMPCKGWNAYDTVSVRFRGQVVATRKDKNRAIHSEDFEEEVDPEEATLPEPDMGETDVARQ